MGEAQPLGTGAGEPGYEPVFIFRVDSRTNWGVGLALKRILAWWQAAAVSAHAVPASTEAQLVSKNY
jgi:hypothetical protein